MSDEQDAKEKGLLIVYTGNGKGKTTASLGMCLRAAGYDWKMCLIQFIKGSWKYGELEGVRKLEPNLELHVVGKGFVGIVDDTRKLSEHKKAAAEGVALALQKIRSGQYQLIILDELCVAAKLGLVSTEDVKTIVAARSEGQHLVITGRDAADWLIEAADLVTEMVETKHPYQKGIVAQKGIDY